MLAQIDFEKLKSSAGLSSPNYPTNIGQIISTAIKFAFPLAGILLLVYLVSGGFSLMTSAGDPKAMQAAKGRISSAILGFVIVFAAYWIVQIVGLILGLPDINNIFG